MTLHRACSRRLFVALAASLPGLLSACAGQPPGQPAPQPTIVCHLQPQATGEKYVGPTVEASPPARVSPGQEISLVLSGAYGFVLNNAVVCDDDEIVGYIMSDELDTFDWARTVEVRFDGRTLTVVECENPCKIEFTLPAQTPLGKHELSLVVARSLEPVTFEIEIARP